MLRIIVREVNVGGVMVGAPHDTAFKTFDVDLPEVEAALKSKGNYISAEVVGVEVLA